MKKQIFSIMMGAALLFTACDSDDNTPPVVNEEELITTVVLTFTPQSGGNSLEFRFTDLDGTGGDKPVISSDTLSDSTIYDVTVQFLNESESPAEDITAEVLAEAEEHQVFFIVEAGLPMGFDYMDTDADGNPLGLLNTFYTGAPGMGELQVILRHEPNKDAQGVDVGDIANAGGETDIEVTFDVVIQ